MRICSIQVPYSLKAQDVPKSIEFLIEKLNSLDESVDLVLTPEYSNAPGTLPLDEYKAFSKKYTPQLLEAVISCAKRCKAIVGVNYLQETFPGVFRNQTSLYNADGQLAGAYYKQHLPQAEKFDMDVDFSYALSNTEVPVVEVDGIKFGFLICYDAYYQEYIANLARQQVDVVLVSSFQRGERQDILESLNKLLAFYCNAYVVRSSVSMGEHATVGGSTMVVSPEGEILANLKNQTGLLIYDIEDIHHKYMRNNSYAGKPVRNEYFIEIGRTPNACRPCGSMLAIEEAFQSFPYVGSLGGLFNNCAKYTLSSLGSLIGSGCNEITLKITFSQDGVPFLGDEEIFNEVLGSKTISDKNSNEIKEKGKLFFNLHKELNSENFATLEEALFRFARHTVFNLYFDKNITEKEVEIISTLMKKHDHQLHYYFTTSKENLEIIYSVIPNIPIALLKDNLTKEEILTLKEEYNIQRLVFSTSNITLEELAWCKEVDIYPGLLTNDINKELLTSLFNSNLAYVVSNNYFENKAILETIKPQLSPYKRRY